MIMMCVSVGGDTSDSMSAGMTQIPTEGDRGDTAYEMLTGRTVMMTKVK